jgi:hypothetical protein
MSRSLLLAALASLALAAPALAEERQAASGTFEFQVGPYRPRIDRDLVAPGTPGPWQTSFGSSRRLLYKLRAGKVLMSRFGALEVGGGIGFMQASGHGLYSSGPLAGRVSPEKTGFMMVPITVDLTYRLDLIWERLGIPLVPFGRVALQSDQWWVTGSGGKTAKSGATNGWATSGGLAVVLDFIDPTLARELDRDTGIKHTMLMVEVTRTKVDDFGSGKSWDLSNDGLLTTFGLAFAF